MIRALLLSLFSLAGMAVMGQAPATGHQIMESLQQRQQLAGSSIFKNYPSRSIGPVVQGGRVSDLAVNPNNHKEYYVAFASGGIFKTRDHGITFTPVFDEQGALGIGDMALAPSDANILYAGTGEKNSSRSSYAGSGVYKSNDGGSTWKHVGLADIHHTSRVIVHPTDPNTLWVASIGALYTHNPARGVYKSIDGGDTWQQTLFINDSTGVIDLLIHPQDPDLLWAAAWERTRRAWNFKGNGPGSGIYHSQDGGTTWERIAGGFPDHEFVGRIGLDLCLQQPNVMYALVDNQQESKKPKEAKKNELLAKDFMEMTVEAFMSLDTARLNKYLRSNGFPEKYDAIKVKEKVSQGAFQPKALADYLGDANQALFDTEVLGAELYRSDDSGVTWEKVNSYDLEGVYFTYGYYFGEVRVAPDNPDKAYVFGVPLLATEDGGSTFHRLDTIGDVHVDHQALWINPDDSDHLLLGNDGGLYVSHDGGGHWRHINNMAVGQFYTVNVDMETPYNVYGGLQDNGVYMGSSRSVPNRTEYWERVFGGDGMFVAADPRNSDLVYTGFQFGNYYRINRNSGKRQRITPKHDIGEDVLRFNWRTPVILSSHNADIIYFGGQKVFRSLDKGDTWHAISGDLTKNQPQGNVPYNTITCIDESPLKFGLLYVGTDDGNAYMTTSGGGDWTSISEDLPSKWVTNIYPSSHEESQVYLSMNGYREDDFHTYVYYSDNYGETWHSLKGNLPEVVINVVKQDLVNPDLLYLGTDHGAYASLDHGQTWHLVTSVPNVAVYDLVVHPRENEVVWATHGRSMYVTDVKPWQQLTASKLQSPVVAYAPKDLQHSEKWGEPRYPWAEPDVPETKVLYYIGQPTEVLKVTVEDEKGALIRELQTDGARGFHYLTWDMKRIPKRRSKETSHVYVGPGTYQITFHHGQQRESVKVVVKEEKD